MQWHRPFQAVPVTVSFAVLTARWTACERLHFAVFSDPREVTRVRPDSQSDSPEHVYYSVTIVPLTTAEWATGLSQDEKVRSLVAPCAMRPLHRIMYSGLRYRGSTHGAPWHIIPDIHDFLSAFVSARPAEYPPSAVRGVVAGRLRGKIWLSGRVSP